MKLEMLYPKTVEECLIEATRKVAYERMADPTVQVEITVTTELFVDMCERIVRLEQRLDDER